MARITAVGTAVPDHAYDQASLRRFASELFGDSPSVSSLFEHAGVDRRHFCFDLDYYRQERPFREKNEDYLRQGLPLIERAAGAALETAGLRPDSIDHLIFVTTTGLATPSVEARLMNRMPFRPTVMRTPIYGLGCAGGAVGLSRAAELTRDGKRALLISLELCGQTFDRTDLSRVNLIAAALFADGAAAAIVEDSGRPGFEVLATRSLFFPQSLDIMGWELRDAGFRLVLSPELPALMRRESRAAVEALLAPHRLKTSDVRHWIVHPGGPKVMDAFLAGLDLPPAALRPSRDFLREYGNLSSASVLFVLDRVLREVRPQRGDWGVLMAAGPGFSFELLLLRF